MWSCSLKVLNYSRLAAEWRMELHGEMTARYTNLKKLKSVLAKQREMMTAIIFRWSPLFVSKNKTNSTSRSLSFCKVWLTLKTAGGPWPSWCFPAQSSWSFNSFRELFVEQRLKDFCPLYCTTEHHPADPFCSLAHFSICCITRTSNTDQCLADTVVVYVGALACSCLSMWKWYSMCDWLI